MLLAFPQRVVPKKKKKLLETLRNVYFSWIIQIAQLGKNLPAMLGDPGSIPGSGRSPGEGNGNPLQYSCLENPMAEEPGGLQFMWSQESDTT